MAASCEELLLPSPCAPVEEEEPEQQPEALLQHVSPAGQHVTEELAGQHWEPSRQQVPGEPQQTCEGPQNLPPQHPVSQQLVPQQVWVPVQQYMEEGVAESPQHWPAVLQQKSEPQQTGWSSVQQTPNAGWSQGIGQLVVL